MVFLTNPAVLRKSLPKLARVEYIRARDNDEAHILRRKYDDDSMQQQQQQTKRQRLGDSAELPINLDYPNLNAHLKRKYDDMIRDELRALKKALTQFRLALYWEPRGRRKWL